MNIYHYAIVRFRPFAETGEFANIGVVAFDAKSGHIHYQLAPRRFRRVTQFFSDLNGKLFSTVVGLLDDELRRVSELSNLRSNETSAAIFASFVKKQESLILCSEVRSTKTDTPLEKFVDDLYERYIKRNFATHEHRESILVREIRDRLKKARLFGFKQHHVDDDLVPVTFQLASKRDGDLYVIKPFAFDQKSTLGIIDHAATWRDRFQQLFERRRLDPSKVLLSIEPPPKDSELNIFEAFDVARSKLGKLPATIVDYDNEEELFSFAARGSHSQRFLVQ